ncbi:rhodanese-like domain-containing protein [Desulfobacula sp.]|uniref:rhodanese-like domain-containing protein n=1 Tax=Desulfobacula sp. TaxID=2593537 RepID=UPI00262C02E6|nr:rhodanese-like domain-containing protein [Desulfobacula sp.]
MKHKQLAWVILLSVFTINFLLIELSYSSEGKVLGEIKDGYRILNLDMNKEIQKFTVYRGDYIKFRLPKEFGESAAVFPTLKEKKQLTHDLETTSYFKMKQTGIHPFQIDSVKGQITVIEYQQVNYRALSSKEANAYIKTDKPLILDVRTRREYAMGHLENSILIPVQELQRRVNELDAHKNNDILIYCATGNRSTVASKILIDSEFTKILNLRRGIVDWARKHYAVVR